MRAQAPVGPGPTGGRFAGSISGTSADTDNGVEISVGSDSAKPKATWIIDGTSAHIIRPVNAKALRWEMAGGDVVFAREVHHPGTSPNPFQEKAVDEINALLQERLPQIVAGAMSQGA